MKSDYYISSAYLRMMLHSNHPLIELLSDTLLAELARESESDYVSGTVINHLFEILHDHGINSWATNFSSQLGVGNHGPLSFAELCAPNLEAALNTLVDYMVVRTNGISTELRLHDNRLEIHMRDRTDHSFAGRWLIESAFLATQHLIESITLHPLADDAKLSFCYPRTNSATDLETIFNMSCHYDSYYNCLSIPATWARIASPLSDPDGFRSNIAKCRELKLNLGLDKTDVHSMVSIRLQNYFERRQSKQFNGVGIPSMDMLASELCMSTRTLIRRLEKQGSSYKKILEQARLNQAQYLLMNTHLPASQIADKLAYQDAANFGRAFKRLIGETPTSWRCKAK